MHLSETQEKDLVQLYWDIKKYAKYLEERTYNPYEKIKRFAEKLGEIIGEDKLNNK